MSIDVGQLGARAARPRRHCAELWRVVLEASCQRHLCRQNDDAERSAASCFGRAYASGGLGEKNSPQNSLCSLHTTAERRAERTTYCKRNVLKIRQKLFAVTCELESHFPKGRSPRIQTLLVICLERRARPALTVSRFMDLRQRPTACQIPCFGEARSKEGEGSGFPEDECRFAVRGLCAPEIFNYAGIQGIQISYEILICP